MNELNLKQTKALREELELPRLHFVVVDNWIDVIGEQAFIAWLKFYSWCDRSDESNESNKWEQAKIPTSFNKLIKRLGVGRGTFYNQILKPLWNVGLIDIEEFEASQNLGQKPMNIIVYKYPNNDITLQTRPLKEVRNYDTDYKSTARTFAKQGGRPKSSDKGDVILVPRENHPHAEIEPSQFHSSTGSGTEIEPNNMFNISFNSHNDLNNKANDIDNKSNSSSFREGKFGDEDEDLIFDELLCFLKEKGFPENTAQKTVSEVKSKGITKFTIDDLVDTLETMGRYNKHNRVNHPHIFFANGLELAIARNALGRFYEDRVKREQDYLPDWVKYEEKDEMITPEEYARFKEELRR